MKYRSEIDGLRAFAVIPVILFHAGFDAFSGGFVGVDVFFVISGFLITTIIIDEMELGKFSLINFYERRARRILPALVFVVMCCIPAAWFILLPNDMKDFAQSLVAVATFSSNMLFWIKSGYFDTAAELKPMLHTWSLAIEEQFYILFPLFLMIVWRFGKVAIVLLLIAVFSASLNAAHSGVNTMPITTFYFLHSRAWELIIGSLAAFYLQDHSVRSPHWVNNALSSVGLAAICYSVFAYDSATPFPSLYALAPTVGTVLIILFASPGTLVHRLLSLRVIVGIGLISYSLYLWHQPVFAFWRHYNLRVPTDAQMLILSLVSILLAVFTYYLVESPFRGRDAVLTRQNVFRASGISLSAVAAFGLLGNYQHGFPSRLTANALAIAEVENDKPDSPCNFTLGEEFPVHPVRECLSNFDAEVVLIGDSHADAISETFLRVLGENGVGAYSTSLNGCVPLQGFTRVDQPPHLDCSGFVTRTIEYARSNGLTTFVLVGRFPLYQYGTWFDNQEGGVEIREPAYVDLVGNRNSHWDDDLRRARVLEHYERRILELADEFNVVLVQPIPEAGWHVPGMGAKMAMRGVSNINLSTDYKVYRSRNEQLVTLFNRLADSDPNIYVANVQDALCNKGRCANIIDNSVLYYDDNHLSSAGAEIVVPAILDVVELALQAER